MAKKKEVKEVVDPIVEEVVVKAKEVSVDRGGNPLEEDAPEKPKYRWFRGKKYPIK